MSRSSDFSIKIEPLEGEVVKGNSIDAKIIVESQKYKDQVKLTFKDQSNKINIAFDPPVISASSNSNSTMSIKVPIDIAEGDYIIEITGIGAKNKTEHSTNYFLKVKNPPFNPQRLVDLFYPDGWMGDIRDITFDPDFVYNSSSGETCIRINYSARGTAGKKWAGIYWLYPNNNFGTNAQGRDLTGATELRFRAMGSRGGERAEFKVGGVIGDFKDSFQPARPIAVTLTPEWAEYVIDLTGKDLSNVFGGFCWVTNTDQNPNGCTIFLDNILFE
jgi:hypothetical protein